MQSFPRINDLFLKVRNRTTILLFSLLPAAYILAGGIDIDPSTFSMNGYPCGSSFLPGDTVLLGFNAHDYSYSGTEDEFEYYVFRITQVVAIDASVGLNAVNNKKDVLTIQSALSALSYYKGPQDAEVSQSLIEAIKQFQRSLQIQNPDGRIDPDGNTLKHLKVPPYYAIKLARDYKEARIDYQFNHEMELILPSRTGTFRLEYNRIGLFRPFVLGVKLSDINIQLNQQAIKEIETHATQYSYSFATLCMFNIHSNTIDTDNSLKVYLRVNNEMPAGNGQFQGGVSPKPLTLSWFARNMEGRKDILFRYKLFPIDNDWSPWTSELEVSYFFIPAGSHQFMLECRYLENQEIKTTPVVQYNFFLSTPMVASPEAYVAPIAEPGVEYIDKGDIRRVSASSAEVIANVYDKSVALLIGVETFSDPTLGALPYTKNDIRDLEKTLRAHKFSIEKPSSDSRSDILAAIRKTLSSAGKNDRVVIYISSHGIVDNINPSKGYLVTSDCSQMKPDDCLSISAIEELIEGSKNNTKHVLLILDACFSGLGVIDKSATGGAIKTVATKEGTHILTAGMNDQVAKMYHTIEQSVFTYFLIMGLTNQTADYTKDGIITLTELLVYVQYNVANYTGAKQTPMLGRISGSGEMIFE